MIARQHNPAFSLLSDFDGLGGAPTAAEIDNLKQAAFFEGHERGVAEGREEAQADCDYRLTEANALFEARVEAERAAMQRDYAEGLGDRLDAAVEAMWRRIEDRVGHLLRPWLLQRVHDRAMQEFEKAVRRAFEDGSKVHIKAPAEILARLRERMSGSPYEIGFSEGAEPEIHAEIGDTEIDANLSAWIAGLETEAT